MLADILAPTYSFVRGECWLLCDYHKLPVPLEAPQGLGLLALISYSKTSLIILPRPACLSYESPLLKLQLLINFIIRNIMEA